MSVVLPVYNESGHVLDEIKRLTEALEASSYSFELIVVDDGSTDGSGEQLRGLEGVRLLRFARNRGTGFARKVGTRAALGRIVVWTDADMTYPNDQVAQLVEELDGCDQVVGARRSEEGTVKALRVPAKWFLRRLAGYLTRTRIPDLNSGFRAFRRDVALQYLHLLPAGFSCVSTMTLAFLANGYSVRYVPIDYFPRAGRSKFHWWTDTNRYLTQVIRLVMTYDPLRVFGPLALSLALLGSVKLGYDLIAHPFRIATNTLLVLFAALQMIVVGLLADLVVRLNRRPDPLAPADST